MSDTKKKGVGVVVGRFQVHDLTKGHKALIDTAAKHGKYCICIGVSPYIATKMNPLDFPSRDQMIREEYPQAQTLHLPDIPGRNEEWSSTLDRLVSSYYPATTEFTYYYGRDSDFAKAYSGRHPIKEIEEVPTESATFVREQVANTIGTSLAWRAGVIHAATNQWPRIDPVVDVAIIRRRGIVQEVLMGKRNHENGKLRLPGGHFDIRKDETGEDAARRECQEETSLEVGDLKYLGQYKIRNGTMLTTLYHAQYTMGAARANDDLDEVFWMPFNDYDKYEYADTHASLVKVAIEATKIDFKPERVAE